MTESLLLVPVGQVHPELLGFLTRELPMRLPLSVQTGEAIALPGSALDRRRMQYRADKILDSIRTPKGVDRTLLIANADLYSDDLNFVFGLAEPPHRRAIIALARLEQAVLSGQSSELYRQRALKEAVHELGHTYGMEHCSRPECVMHFSNTLGDTDFKGTEFCRFHARQLPSLEPR